MINVELSVSSWFYEIHEGLIFFVIDFFFIFGAINPAGKKDKNHRNKKIKVNT